MSMEDI